MWFFYPTKGESLNFLDLQGDPRLVRYPDLPIKKTLRVVGLVTVMTFFQSKKFTACKIKDGEEETIFKFLMVFNLLTIIHPFQGKKNIKDVVKRKGACVKIPTEMKKML